MRGDLAQYNRAALAALEKHIRVGIDKGEVRVAEREANGKWKVNQWLKKAVLLSFRLNDMSMISNGPGGSSWWDKVPSKFDGWTEKEFRAGGFRAVPNCVVRKSAYIAPGAILMPSFVNLGAYVDTGTMVDTWVTVGSCAQLGKNVHLSGGVGIGGVLEPLQANPTIIEDNCFIGARSEVVEGVIVGEGVMDGVNVALGSGVAVKRGVKDTIGASVRVGTCGAAALPLVAGEGCAGVASWQPASTRRDASRSQIIQQALGRIRFTSAYRSPSTESSLTAFRPVHKQRRWWGLSGAGGRSIRRRSLAARGEQQAHPVNEAVGGVWLGHVTVRARLQHFTDRLRLDFGR